jgi:hypothetical protein
MSHEKATRAAHINDVRDCGAENMGLTASILGVTRCDK